MRFAYNKEADIFQSLMIERKQKRENIMKELYKDNEINYELLFNNYNTIVYGSNSGYTWNIMDDSKIFKLIIERNKRINLFKSKELSEKEKNILSSIEKSPEEIEERILYHAKKCVNEKNINIDMVCKVFNINKSIILNEKYYDNSEYSSNNEDNNEDIKKQTPKRHGFKWTYEEDKQLMESASKNMTLEEIANIHNRSVGSIKLRIIANAYNIMKTENKTIEDVCNMYYNIEEKDIIEHIKVLELREIKRKRKINLNNDNNDNNYNINNINNIISNILPSLFKMNNKI